MEQTIAEREQRLIQLEDRNPRKQDTRTAANKLTQAGHKLIDVAFDLLQMDVDGVTDITAVIVELTGDDYKVRYVFDDK